MNIWVPRTKIIEPKQAILSPVQLQGFFKFEAGKRDGRRRLLADWFPNLILDQGLDLPGAGSSWLAACRVGTGSTTPAAGQTNLVAHLAGTTSHGTDVTTAQPSAPYYGSVQRTYRFAEGDAAGNLAEVGVGTSDTDGSNLFSRALILDGGGDPTTLTVQADEFLDVSYELRCYVPTVDATGSITITGVGDLGFTARAANANSTVWAPPFAGGEGNSTQGYDGGLGLITAGPAGTNVSASSDTNAAYGAGNHYRDYTCVFGLDAGNFGTGLLSVLARMGCGEMQFEFDDPIMKTSAQTLALVFRHSWARKTL